MSAKQKITEALDNVLIAYNGLFIPDKYKKKEFKYSEGSDVWFYLTDNTVYITYDNRPIFFYKKGCTLTTCVDVTSKELIMICEGTVDKINKACTRIIEEHENINAQAKSYIHNSWLNKKRNT